VWTERENSESNAKLVIIIINKNNKMSSNNTPDGWEQWDELPEDQFPKLSQLNNKNQNNSNSIQQPNLSKPKQRPVNTYVEPPIPEIVLRDTQPKFRILQKPSGKNSPPTVTNNTLTNNPQSGTNGNNNQTPKTTIEARLEDYEKARKRIFENEQNAQNNISDESKRKRNDKKGF